MTHRISTSLLSAAEEVLLQVLRFEYPADGILSHFFRERRELGQRDRAFIAEAVYAVLRNKRHLELLCGDKANARQLLLACLTHVQGNSERHLEEGLSEADKEWLTSLRGKEMPPLTLAQQADLPDWLVDRLLALMPEEDLLALARGLNQAAPLDVRNNPLKISRADLLQQLAAEKLEAEACPLAPNGIRLRHKIALNRHPLFVNGSLEVQDEGSQVLTHLVQPRRGEMVVDFCAGAGGKTLLLGAQMRSSGRLYAFDISEKRLAKLKPRAARAGLSNIHPACISSENDHRIKRLAGKIDRVLVDAPCSGLGTLRRNPDLKWRQTPQSIAELSTKQAQILASASRLVKAGGRLVYATCSILPEENEAVVEAFLAAHPQFKQISAQEILNKQGIGYTGGMNLRLLPHVHGSDGFFAAVMERSA